MEEVRGVDGLDGESNFFFLFKCIAGWSLHCGPYSFVKCTLSHVDSSSGEIRQCLVIVMQKSSFKYLIIKEVITVKMLQNMNSNITCQVSYALSVH